MPDATVPRRPPFRVWEWLLRSGPLAAIRAEQRGRSAEQRDYGRRARVALELADRAHTPTEPFAAGAAPDVACELYREACHFALAAFGGSGRPLPPIAELWDGADAALLSEAAPDGEVASVKTSVIESRFVDDASAAPAEQARSAALLRRFSHALLARWESLEKREDALVYERNARLGVVALALFALLSIAAARVAEWLDVRGDLAAGRPWRASSSYGVCSPEEHRCAGAETDIFFHTNEEYSPWLELDLGSPRAFSSVRIRNRLDCCEERAVPLVVEASDNRLHFSELARRKKTFRNVTLKFPQHTARYVRLRVAATSILHLELVRVFP